MNKKIRSLLFLLSLSIIVISCGKAFYKPSESNAEKSGFSLAELEEGRKLYTSKCVGCHKLYAPSSRNNEQWNKVLDFMQPKAKISDQERQLVFQYLISE